MKTTSEIRQEFLDFFEIKGASESSLQFIGAR